MATSNDTQHIRKTTHELQGNAKITRLAENLIYLRVVEVLELSPNQPLLSGVKTFVDAIEQGGAQVVYAGKIAANALQSSQLPQVEWDAFVLAQYPSREAYSASEADPNYQRVRSSFANSYALGMKRSPWSNLAIPIALLGNGPTHIGDAVTLEGDADFDQVVIVYYPGVEYFAEMLQSEFFTGIVGGKQLGDTLSSPTVPLLPHL